MVLFYGHSPCYLSPDKDSPGHPQGTEREGERRQAVPRDMLGGEQAGDPSRPASPGMVGGAASSQCEGGGVRGLPAQITKGMRENSRWGDPLSPFVWDWGALRDAGLSLLKLGDFGL